MTAAHNLESEPELVTKPKPKHNPDPNGRLAFIADNQARVAAGVLYRLASNREPQGWLHGGSISLLNNTWGLGRR